jgi:hypothetical protein
MESGIKVKIGLEKSNDQNRISYIQVTSYMNLVFFHNLSIRNDRVILVSKMPLNPIK